MWPGAKRITVLTGTGTYEIRLTVRDRPLRFWDTNHSLRKRGRWSLPRTRPSHSGQDVLVTCKSSLRRSPCTCGCGYPTPPDGPRGRVTGSRSVVSLRSRVVGVVGRSGTWIFRPGRPLDGGSVVRSVNLLSSVETTSSHRRKLFSLNNGTQCFRVRTFVTPNLVRQVSYSEPWPKIKEGQQASTVSISVLTYWEHTSSRRVWHYVFIETPT